jgi:soluble lytic murein transglycosylase-like protein
MSKRVQLGAWATVILLWTIVTLPCFAADSAVLRNGFAIRFERRQDMGLITRLYVNGDESSFVDVPTAEIDHIEAAPNGPNSVANSQAAQPAKASTERPVDIDELVASASGMYRLDPDLVNSVIRAESGFNVRAVSPKGAQGLMQLMPRTASLLGVQNVFDPQANVAGGARYLRELLERYNFDLIKALAAYNAGPERVEQYGGVPPYYETRAYVARIVRDFNRKKLAQKNGTRSVASQNNTPANRPNARANQKLAAAHKPQGSAMSGADAGSSPH